MLRKISDSAHYVYDIDINFGMVLPTSMTQLGQ